MKNLKVIYLDLKFSHQIATNNKTVSGIMTTSYKKKPSWQKWP